MSYFEEILNGYLEFNKTKKVLYIVIYDFKYTNNFINANI